MSELFLDNLRQHIKRGLDGVVRDGRYPGGRAYGYRPTQTPGVLRSSPSRLKSSCAYLVNTPQGRAHGTSRLD
jgi:hypothetical protein